ncbi:hypothetical protein D6T17_23305 [Salmonella enterica subsp. enterica serovar Oranienburg]|nr:hypothetical protein [Salmonella enterica subsp. enterica serovar Oranienburg]EBY8947201.1 hypothetical protein [Salmonella enterica subsp. enterica serovar Oranienburg]
MNIIDTWLKSFSALPPPEKVGWVFVCIIMMLTLFPEIKFVFFNTVAVIRGVIRFIRGRVMK